MSHMDRVQTLNDIKIYLFADFENCNDPVRTEELIYKQISERTVLTSYIYAAFPIAWTINTHGLQTTQDIIYKTFAHKNLQNKKLFFVCQHIRVHDLNFGSHVVFTPHATVMDNYQAIPHYASNFVKKHKKPFDKRQYLMSFVGSFRTHYTRPKLKDILKNRNDCYIEDSGQWNFEKNNVDRLASESKFVNLLNDTKIALCPRGTGPSTIRIWEAMASGCVPLIISDYLKMPKGHMFDWSDMAIFVPEKDIDRIFDFIPDEHTIADMAKVGSEIYKKHFSNDNLYKSVISLI